MGLLCKWFGWWCAVAPTPVSQPAPVVEKPVVVSESKELVDRLAIESGCANFLFNDYNKQKSKLPVGYIKGLAQSFAQTKCKQEFRADKDLAYKYALILGLGQWECSGMCCGLDRSSRNPNYGRINSNNAEAGHWQSSYDLGLAKGIFPKFMNEWSGDCFASYFDSCNGQDAENFGTGAGLEFQKKAKACPAFGAEVVLKYWPWKNAHYWPFKKSIAQAPDVCVNMFKKIDAAIVCP